MSSSERWWESPLVVVPTSLAALGIVTAVLVNGGEGAFSFSGAVMAAAISAVAVLLVTNRQGFLSRRQEERVHFRRMRAHGHEIALHFRLVKTKVDIVIAELNAHALAMQHREMKRYANAFSVSPNPYRASTRNLGEWRTAIETAAEPPDGIERDIGHLPTELALAILAIKARLAEIKKVSLSLDGTASNQIPNSRESFQLLRDLQELSGACEQIRSKATDYWQRLDSELAK